LAHLQRYANSFRGISI